MSHIGYKRCGYYVVKLKIIGENNENRDNVVDSCKKYAKFRASKAFVEEIFNLNGGVSNISEVRSNYDSDFVYEKGKVVEVKDYDICETEVCSTGIHYFLSFEAAKFYGEMPYNYTGEWKEFYENGQLECQGEFKNGKEEGEHKYWYANSQLRNQGEWKNGKKEGKHKQWYENGLLAYQGEFKNCKEEGVH